MRFAECVPFCARQAFFDDIQVETVMSEIDILLSSTGNVSLETLHTLTTRSTRLARRPGRHESPLCQALKISASSPWFTV